MKKFVLIGISVLVIIGVVAAICLLYGDTEQEVLTYTDATETIEIGVDGEFIIALDSNSSTGYSWTASYDETMFELVSENYEEAATDGLVVGAGGTQYFYFKALQSGEVTITLDYKASWQTDSAEQVVFTVNIN